ncbi:MAG: dihydroorotate dehydrogenase [Firmicutes bacterium]|nr:dihydroorotate dehydrogenase [Bacillota bacterium]
MTTPDLSVEIAGITFQNPVMQGAGTFGEEYADFVDFTKLGAIVPKSVTEHPRPGNPPPRIVETPAGMVNAIGVENPGVDWYLNELVPRLRRYGVPIIASVYGEGDLDSYRRITGRFSSRTGVAAVELDLKFFSNPDEVNKVVSVCVGETDIPVFVKLTPFLGDNVERAIAAEAGGARALTLGNTIRAMVIDIEKRRPRLGGVVGGLSGPCIRPIGVKIVWDAAAEVRVPIIGVGGITDGPSAIEYLLAGATAVAVGSYNFVNPWATLDVIEGISHYLAENGFASVREIVGLARRNFEAETATPGEPRDLV